MRPALVTHEMEKFEEGVQRKARHKALDVVSGQAGGSGTLDNQPTWPELPRAAMHGLAGRIVRSIEPHTESDPVALLVQLLVVFGNAIGRSAYFRAEADYHYCNLYALLVGRTSKGRKGTSLGYVKRLIERAEEQYARDCLYSGAASGEGIVYAVRDAVEEKRALKEKGRTTGYETVISDHGVSDKRMLMVLSEFASFLRVMSRDGNTLSSLWRECWDGHSVLRVMTRNSPLKATGAHVSSIAHITMDELLRNIDETDKANGFANRILYTLVRRSKTLPEGGNLQDFDVNIYVQDLHKALEFARGRHELKRDAEARALWHEVYPKLSEGRPGMLGAVTSRAEAQTMRLACIYALLDCSEVIGRVHLQAALSLWQYCEDSARYIFGDALGDHLADQILEALRAVDDGGLTRSQIRDLFRRNVDADRIAGALRALSENGLAHSRKELGDGRPTERWFATETIKSNMTYASEHNGHAAKRSSLPDEIYFPANATDEEIKRICAEDQIA